MRVGGEIIKILNLRADSEASITIGIGQIDFDETKLHIDMFSIVTLPIIVWCDDGVTRIRFTHFKHINVFQLWPI